MGGVSGESGGQLGALEPRYTPPHLSWRSQAWHVVQEVEAKALCHLGVSLHLPDGVV